MQAILWLVKLDLQVETRIEAIRVGTATDRPQVEGQAIAQSRGVEFVNKTGARFG
jgi:hypothetical protein